MVLKLRNKHIVDEVEFKENRDDKIAIPQDNPLRRLTLTFFIDITNGGTVPAAIKTGDILNLVKRIQVIFNGATNKVDVDLLSYFFASAYQSGTLPFKTFGVGAASTTVNNKVTVTIDFAQLKNNLTDFSGLFNAPAFSSLDLKIAWGDINDIYGTVNSATIAATSRCELAITEVYDNGQGENQLSEVVLAAQDIREGIDVTNIDKEYDSYGGNELEAKILPVPSTILEHCLIAQNNVTDGSPTLSNTVIEQLKLENVRGGEELIFYDTWINYFEQNKAEYSLETGSHQDGTLFISWNELRLEGLLNNVVDALKYKFLTAAPTALKTNAVRVYKKYIVITQPTSTA